jgi:hypothetical protein
MTVAAPPRPSQLREPAGQDHPGEALIKEARRRARRRRWIGSAAALAVAIAGVAAFSLANTAPPHGAARNVPPRPRPQPVTPQVQGPDAASTLLASWGGFPFGWAFVYADGRMIWHYDGGYWSNADPPGARERRLSPHGLDLIRTGKIAPGDFLRGSPYLWHHPQEKLWAEPTARPYEPSKYAIWYPEWMGDADRAFDQLPPAAQAVLRGKERTYDPNIGTDTWPRGLGDLEGRPPSYPPFPPIEGFEVTAAEASALRQTFGDGLAAYTFLAIYPHGQPLTWFGG